MLRETVCSHRIIATLSLVVAAACARTDAPPPHAAAAPHEAKWGYTGDDAPAHWGALSPTFLTCDTGTTQSPVDLANATKEDIPNIAFTYSPSKVNILNNGHEILVAYDSGSSITIDSVAYALIQFHFHAPSEHLVNGRRFDAELHLVHRSAAGRLAVVGVLIAKGKANPAFASVWANLPAAAGPVQHTDAVVYADSLLPATRMTYRYTGSLTAPPCSENVRWSVMTAPVQLSDAQLSALTTIVAGNSRPVQPLGNRALVEDISAAR